MDEVQSVLYEQWMKYKAYCTDDGRSQPNDTDEVSVGKITWTRRGWARVIRRARQKYPQRDQSLSRHWLPLPYSPFGISHGQESLPPGHQAKQLEWIG